MPWSWQTVKSLTQTYPVFCPRDRISLCSHCPDLWGTTPSRPTCSLLLIFKPHLRHYFLHSFPEPQDMLSPCPPQQPPCPCEWLFLCINCLLPKLNLYVCLFHYLWGPLRQERCLTHSCIYLAQLLAPCRFLVCIYWLKFHHVVELHEVSTFI